MYNIFQKFFIFLSKKDWKIVKYKMASAQPSIKIEDFHQKSTDETKPVNVSSPSINKRISNSPPAQRIKQSVCKGLSSIICGASQEEVLHFIFRRIFFTENSIVIAKFEIACRRFFFVFKNPLQN